MNRKPYEREDKELIDKYIAVIKNTINVSPIAKKEEVALILNYINVTINRSPLMVLPDKFTSYKDSMKFIKDLDVVNKILDQGTLCIKKPFFNRMVYSFHIHEEFDDDGKGLYILRDRISCYIDIDKNCGEIFVQDICDEDKGKNAIFNIPFTLSLNEIDSRFKISVDYNKINRNNIRLLNISTLKYLLSIKYEGEDPEQQLSEMLYSLFIKLVQKLGELHVNDYYMVKKTPIIPELKKKDGLGKRADIIWLKSLAPKIIFVNNFHEVNGYSNNEESVTEMRPHKRRGYWCTLKAERFKNHPLYLKPKALYKKPTWIGPEQIDYEGNTYKVLINLEEKETREENEHGNISEK